MSDFNLTQDWANVPYDVDVVPALSQIQQYSAFDGDAIPGPENDFNLLPPIVQPIGEPLI